jgi:hypothetical protein
LATPTQKKSRRRLSLILGTLVAGVMLSAVAFADIVTVNDVITGGDTALTRGMTGTAGVTIAASNTVPAGDANGCNANGANPATVTLNSNSANVTVDSPVSKSYVGCATLQTFGYTVASGAILGSLTELRTATTGGKAGSLYNEDGFTVRVLPRPASGLSATANGASQVDLSWTASPDAADITDYKIYEGATEVGTAANNVTTKSITGLASGSTHCYTIKARVNVGGTDYFSAASNSSCATTASDTTAPVITKTITGTAGTGGWYKSDVTVEWTVTDPDSAVTIDSGCGTQTFTSESAGSTSSCQAHSAGGSSSDSVTIKIDKTKPLISATATKADSSPYVADTWTNQNVTVSFTCADGGAVSSGLATNTVAGATLSGETDTGSVTNSGACTDNAGNSAESNTFSPIKIDKTKPVISATATNADDSAYAAGTWTNQDVTVSFSCADDAGGANSGLASNTVGGGGTQSAETATGGFTSTGGCTDSAGNSANPKTFSPIKIDKTKPVISATATKADSSPYVADTWTNQSVTVSFTCADDAGTVNSGVGSNTLTGDTISGETATGSVTNGGACTDNAGNNANSKTFSPIKVDKTKPVISASAKNADDTAYVADTWTNQSVTVSFTCADEAGTVNSGLASNTVTGGTVSGETATGSVTNGGACVDNAGNGANPNTFSPIKIDKTKPVISATAKNADDTTYPADTWTNQSVTVSFSCTDSAGTANSGLASNNVGGGGTQSAETATGSFTNSGGCTDNAGNEGNSNTFSPIKVDKTKPLISGSRTPPANSYGWNNTNVAVAFSCADTGGVQSGIQTDTVPDATVSSEGANQSVTSTGDCIDKAGNPGNAATISGISIDKTMPLLNISGPANDTTFNVCAPPSRPTFSPSDALSGLASQSDTWTSALNGSDVGSYTYSAHATDKADNQKTENRTYPVVYGVAFSGYLQPINSDGSSRFKLGSTVPVKFQLMCNGVPISTAVARMYVKQGDSQPDPGVDEPISSAASTTGNLFRYDATAKQYIFNLSTKLGYTNPDNSSINNFSQGTWTLKIGLDDGTFKSINIQLVR